MPIDRSLAFANIQDEAAQERAGALRPARPGPSICMTMASAICPAISSPVSVSASRSRERIEPGAKIDSRAGDAPERIEHEHLAALPHRRLGVRPTSGGLP